MTRPVLLLAGALAFGPACKRPSPSAPPAPAPVQPCPGNAASLVRIVDAHHCLVPRALLAGPNQGCLTERLIARVAGDAGEVRFQLVGLKPQSMWARCGLRNGDVVRMVNGRAMNTPEAALAAYQELGAGGVLRFEIDRAGAPLRYEVGAY